jgi:hypothetical protein
METIVAGRFETSEKADAAVRELIAAGFRHEDASAFFVNPPGQHAKLPLGGDEYADPEAGRAGSGAIAGAVAGGAVGLAAAMAVPGVNVAILLGVVGVGAYTGSLAGTLAKLSAGRPREVPAPTPERPAGVLVAVRVLDRGDKAAPKDVGAKYPSAEDIAIQILREAGAKDIERATGTWQDGEWKDFDPVAPVQLVDTN